MARIKKRFGDENKSRIKYKTKLGFLIFLLVLFSLLFIVFLVIFIKEFVIREVSLAPNTINIFNCGILAQPDTEYLLQNDVINESDCFTITADNIILNGQGRKATYDTLGSNNRDAVKITNANFSVVKNLIIEDGNINGQSDNAIYVFSGNGVVIENNDIKAFNASAIRLERSNFSSVINNTLNLTASGIQLIDSSFAIVKENNIVNLVPSIDSSKNTRSIYLSAGSYYNKVFNNTITTYNINGFGIQIQGSSHNLLEDNFVTTFNDSADAFRIIGGTSLNNTLKRLKLITNGGNSAGGLLVSNTNNSFIMSDSSISSSGSGSYDIEIGSSSNGGIWELVNVSHFDKNWAGGANGSLSVYWHFDSRVVDNLNAPLQNANVNAFDGFSTEVFNFLTNVNGYIPRQTLLEYTQINGALPIFFTPYSIEYLKSGHEFSLESVSLGASTFIQKQLNDITVPVININLPQAQTYSSNVSLGLNYTAQDSGGGLASCKYNFNNGANISSSCNLDTTFNISVGTHTLYVFATDVYGNTAVNNVTFQVNFDLPSLVLDFPLANSYLNYRNNIYFRYTPYDINGISICYLYSNLNGSFSINQTDNLIVNGAQNNFEPLNLSEGNYIWNVLCRDSLGNENFALSNFSFGVDITNPVIVNISSPLAYPSNILCSRTVSLNYNINEANVDYCFFRVINSTNVVIQDTNISSCTSSSFSINSGNEERNLSLTLTAVDKAGNIGISSKVFYIDTDYSSCIGTNQTNVTNQSTSQVPVTNAGSITNNTPGNNDAQQNQDDLEAGLEFQKILVNEEANSFSINEGETVILELAGKEYNALFELGDGAIELEIGSAKYKVGEGKVIGISLGGMKVYIGVKDITADDASVAIGLNESKIRERLGITGGRRTAAYVLLIVVMTLLIGGVVVILYYILKASQEEQALQNSSGQQGTQQRTQA